MSGVDSLRARIEALREATAPPADQVRAAVSELLVALEHGNARAAECVDGRWIAHGWVKSGILLGFRFGKNVPYATAGPLHFRDRDTFPTWDPGSTDRDVRIVPGGSSVRRGAYLGAGVVLMPPCFVNVGAWVGDGTMIDSHALVGSCAQIGRRVHLSAAAQVGGVLEPIGALPVIVEDDVFVGGGCGIYEGTRVGTRAVLAAGVVLTRSVPLYDLVRGEEIRADGGGPLVVPEGAVVVPGSRPASGEFAARRGIHLHAPVIVKYRDASTSAAAALEGALR